MAKNLKKHIRKTKKNRRFAAKNLVFFKIPFFLNFLGHLPEHGTDIGQWSDDFSSRLANVFMEKLYTTFLLHQTFLEREKHEKQGPKFRNILQVVEKRELHFLVTPKTSKIIPKKIVFLLGFESVILIFRPPGVFFMTRSPTLRNWTLKASMDR